ncbi:hypothetical protein Lal_00029044 [Lupinus albus]|uniref:Putative triacylglycerol lipase n=1 Tax=Lupinus albus TaxID=3870 RepID=A0A6A4P4E9_LUPAL|nr:putative triacylglycerol lipase [Lupinus albus]KAF1885155.1 hypothetical protein Lal_00029044 [Lupinus albus]
MRSEVGRRWEEVGSAVVVVVLLLWTNGVGEVKSHWVPALFVFGDSLVDVGNNNFLNCIARANYFPYGIDFDRGATGRWSNGKSFIDFIGEMLGVPSPPPFADPATVGARILNGVNYASATSGILDESGRHYGYRYSLNQQILNFERTLSQYRMTMMNNTNEYRTMMNNTNEYRTMMNATTLNQFLAKSIAIVASGSNDYINNYLLPPLYRTSYTYNAQEFGNLLVNSYVRQILALHSLGLRKFFLSGIGPLGCIPSQRAGRLAVPGRCADVVNQMVGFFNEGLRSMVDQLNKDHPHSMFVYGNAYGVFGDILNNPSAYSFTVIDRACCGLGTYRGQISCLPFQVPCVLRNQYVYWDAFNPTQSAIYVYSWRAVHGPQNDAYPINVQQLAQM